MKRKMSTIVLAAVLTMGIALTFVPITYAAEDQVNIVSVESQTQSKWRNRI